MLQIFVYVQINVRAHVFENFNLNHVIGNVLVNVNDVKGDMRVNVNIKVNDLHGNEKVCINMYMLMWMHVYL